MGIPRSKSASGTLKHQVLLRLEARAVYVGFAAGSFRPPVAVPDPKPPDRRRIRRTGSRRSPSRRTNTSCQQMRAPSVPWPNATGRCSGLHGQRLHSKRSRQGHHATERPEPRAPAVEAALAQSLSCTKLADRRTCGIEAPHHCAPTAHVQSPAPLPTHRFDLTSCRCEGLWETDQHRGGTPTPNRFRANHGPARSSLSLSLSLSQS